jgi:iron complex transport system substrate-binding protein
MAPSITESLFALGLGDRLVGATTFCKYPPEVEKLPKIGGYLDPNFEAVINLKPDLVILLTEQEDSAPRFQKLGLPTLVVHHKTVDGVIESLRLMGECCGVGERGRLLAVQLESRMEKIRRKTAGLKRPKAMIVVDREPDTSRLADVYIAGADDYFDRMIEIAGGENAYRDTLVRFPTVSAEGMIRMNPDVIVDLTEQNLDDWRSLGAVEAVKRHRVYAIQRDYANPGPRMIEFIEKLAQWLHPELDGGKP